jgi:hypothetical protein
MKKQPRESWARNCGDRNCSGESQPSGGGATLAKAILEWRTKLRLSSTMARVVVDADVIGPS